MKLKYVRYPKYKYNIKNIYLKSFPKEERFPFLILEKCSKENKSDLYAVLDNDIFVGMIYIVNCDDAYYLMFLAVENELRNKKYGSNILNDLKERYKVLFLSIEKPVDEDSIRRKKFYLNNGFYETNKYYEDNNVIYEILCSDKKMKIDKIILKKRYENMTNSKITKIIIGKLFNMNNIELYDKEKY